MTKARTPNRVVVGVALATLGLACVANLAAFTALVAVVAAGCLFELFGLTNRRSGRRGAIIAAVASAAYLVCAAAGRLARDEGLLVVATLLVSLVAELGGERSGYGERVASTLFATFYVGKLLAYFPQIRAVPSAGAALTVTVIVVIACTDIFAMLAGKAWGRHPLTIISPRKTVEGALGGLAAATLAGACAAAFAPVLALTLWQGALLGAATSLAAQTGDVVESALKRDADVKDAGSVLAGHGGVLDRFDSYLFGGVVFWGMTNLLRHG